MKLKTSLNTAGHQGSLSAGKLSLISFKNANMFAFLYDSKLALTSLNKITDPEIHMKRSILEQV